jgi:nucleoid DNA-binding protein
MNNNGLDKDGFARALADKTDYTLGDCRHFVNCLIEVFSDCILNEIPLDIRGFGHLYFQLLPERDGFKPIRGKKGEGTKMHYPETTRVIFKLATNLRALAKMELVDEEEATV